jgi:carbon storage regulator
MLVLSRKIGQRVMIGGGIMVTVVAARGGQVRLGVEAPQDVTILRDELSASDDTASSTRPARTPRGRSGARARP